MNGIKRLILDATANSLVADPEDVRDLSRRVEGLTLEVKRDRLTSSCVNRHSRASFRLAWYQELYQVMPVAPEVLSGQARTSVPRGSRWAALAPRPGSGPGLGDGLLRLTFPSAPLRS